LYVSRLIKQESKGKLKSSLIFDEFPTIYLNNMDSLPPHRSNKSSHLFRSKILVNFCKDYGREQLMIMNITGNIAMVVTGDTAAKCQRAFWWRRIAIDK
jgi:hypothetical protein